MYLSHFGLNQSPFGITPNPAFFYSGSKRGDILEALIYAVTHGEGIIKVTGEVGSGKTMLCRMLESMMPENVEVIYLVNPTLNREEVVFAIAGELEIITVGKRPDEVIRMLQTDLITKHVNGKQVVLLVEEAQAMPLETLEEIRLFSNLETAHHKLLQIVLFGQPELDESLNLPRMRQLKERITHSFKVPPMTPTVIPEFLMFRMRAAGYHGPDIFSKGAVKLLAAVSEGIVRRINILADKSLLAAFADNTHSIQAKHVKAAIRDSEFSFSSARLASPHRNLVIGLMVSVAVIIAADIGWRTYGPNRPSTTDAAIVSRPAVKANVAETATAGSSASVKAAPPAEIAARAPQAASNLAGAPPTTPAMINQSAPQAGTSTPIAAPAEAAKPVQDASSSGSTTTANPTAATPAAAIVAPPSEVRKTPVSATPLPTPTAPSATDTTQIRSTSGILQQRVAASQDWLRNGDADNYTIQVALLPIDDFAKIESFIKKTGAEVGIDQVHLYPTRIAGSPRLGIVYSSFGTREEARLKRIDLAHKWDYRAQLRTIGGLRAEILRTHSEEWWPK